MIVVNDRPRPYQDGLTVRTLLLDLGFDPEAMVVVLNGKAARHNAFGSTAVRDGDVLEVEEVEGGREG